MNIISYFYYSQPKLSQSSSPPIPPQPTKPLKSKTNKQKIVYVVLNKSQQVLGVFDTLELAKSNGQKSTYNNCIIYEYTINQKCTFLKNPIFEDN